MQEKSSQLKLFAVLVVLAGLIGWFGKSKSLEFSAMSFEECVSQGNPVMESYPAQCVDRAGNNFTQDVGNEIEKSDLIRLFSPRPGEKVASPIQISGEARGYWFFEGSFPVVVTDWDGKIIGQGIATAQDEWMTEEFVPFTAEITYDKTQIAGGYSNKGTLILKKDNPSGLPENDDVLEIPIVLGE